MLMGSHFTPRHLATVLRMEEADRELPLRCEAHKSEVLTHPLHGECHLVLGRGGPSLNVVFDIERELERANALGAFLSMDEYSPDALVASLELLTKRARHIPLN